MNYKVIIAEMYYHPKHVISDSVYFDESKYIPEYIASQATSNVNRIQFWMKLAHPEWLSFGFVSASSINHEWPAEQENTKHQQKIY